MGSPRDDLMIPSTYVHVLIRHLLGILESIPLLTQNLGSLGITWSLLIQSIVERKKIQATYGPWFYDPVFCNILAFSLLDSKFYFLLLSTQFFTFHEAKYYIQTPSILSYITAIYFFFQFSSPYKSSYRARRDKVWCGVSGSIMFLL